MATNRKTSDQPTRPVANSNDEEIRARAYELYEARGREPGREWDDWLQAEREVRSGREDE